MSLSEEDLTAICARLRRQTYYPSPEVHELSAVEPFMKYSTCSARDFLHPEFRRLSALVGLAEHYHVYHRKHWEFVYILHHAFRTGAVGPGKRGLVFGVGSERLPSAFAEAGTQITATDAPPEIGIQAGWTIGNQYAQGLAAIPHGRITREAFESLVEFSFCDMNNIAPRFHGYDFCWSSCALEHLGTLQHGLDFILNSLDTLKVGGIAIHTTEFNLSSNQNTVESGYTVIYRRKDIDGLISRLRAMGHEVDEFRVAPDSYTMDSFVDLPPYLHSPHLKLEIDGYVATSAGITVRRCR